MIPKNRRKEQCLWKGELSTKMLGAKLVSTANSSWPQGHHLLTNSLRSDAPHQIEWGMLGSEMFCNDKVLWQPFNDENQLEWLNIVSPSVCLISGISLGQQRMLWSLHTDREGQVTRNKSWVRGHGSSVEHFPSKGEALSSDPSTTVTTRTTTTKTWVLPDG